MLFTCYWYLCLQEGTFILLAKKMILFVCLKVDALSYQGISFYKVSENLSRISIKNLHSFYGVSEQSFHRVSEQKDFYGVSEQSFYRVQGSQNQDMMTSQHCSCTRSLDIWGRLITLSCFMLDPYWMLFTNMVSSVPQICCDNTGANHVNELQYMVGSGGLKHQLSTDPAVIKCITVLWLSLFVGWMAQQFRCWLDGRSGF